MTRHVKCKLCFSCIHVPHKRSQPAQSGFRQISSKVYIDAFFLHVRKFQYFWRVQVYVSFHVNSSSSLICDSSIPFSTAKGGQQKAASSVRRASKGCGTLASAQVYSLALNVKSLCYPGAGRQRSSHSQRQMPESLLKQPA